MTGRQGMAAFLLGLALTSEVPAQVIVAPTGFAPPPIVVVPGGFGFVYGRRSFVGYYPLSPPGVVFVGGQVTIRVISPRSVFSAPEVDLRGVDLDVVGPEALHGKPGVAKVPEQPPNKRPAADIPRPAEAPAKRALPEPPKKEAPPPPKPLPPKAPDIEKPAPPGPRAEPLDESRRLIELGLASFRTQEYGLAALRFQQAAELAPAEGRPHFLLAQANMAMGKYKQAVAGIENGLLRQEDWPLSAFQPRVDLYKGNEGDWFTHKKHLADVQALNPHQAAYLFLQAYEWWFDGQREQAAEMFERAKTLAPANPFIGAFLRVNPKLAAK